MIFNGPIGKFLIAILLLIAGVALIGCGVNVCWLRFRRKKGKEIDPKDILHPPWAGR